MDPEPGRGSTPLGSRSTATGRASPHLGRRRRLNKAEPSRQRRGLGAIRGFALGWLWAVGQLSPYYVIRGEAQMSRWANGVSLRAW